MSVPAQVSDQNTSPSSPLLARLKNSFTSSSDDTAGVSQSVLPSTSSSAASTTSPVLQAFSDSLLGKSDSPSPSTATLSQDPVQSEVQSQPHSQIPEEVINSEPVVTPSVPQEEAFPPQNEAELTALASAVPLAVEQSTDTLNPPHPTGSLAKESPLLNVSVEKPVVDQVPGMQVVEVEHTPELPPEVEGYIKKVENHPDQIPNEVVISNPATGQSTPRVLAQPVIVLPITAEIERQGARKPTNFSIRWLVEWSRKIMKAFSGKVVYREG